MATDRNEIDTRGLARRLLPAEIAAVGRRREPAAFASTSVVEFCDGGCPTPGDPDDLVIRKGLIFRVGRYDDVNFDMTAADLSRAKRLFRPVPIRLEHKDTVLDGKLGTLRSVDLSADGSELHGEAALPRWLANLMPAGMPLKVSASWDRATKLLRELSLVLSPRIEGAALAAFSHPTQPQRTATMTHETETPEAKRARIDSHLANTDLGRAVLAARAPAVFSAVAEAPAAAPAFAYNPGFVITREAARHALGPEPVHPDDATEAAFLEAARRVDSAGLLAAIRSRVAALETAPQADVALAESNHIDWRAHVAPRAAELARLRCMAKALEGAKPGAAIRYSGPDAAALLDASGRILATALNKAGGRTLGQLVGSARGRRQKLGEAGPSASEALEKAARASLASGMTDAAYQEGHRALIRESEARAEREAIAALLDGDALKSTLSALVGRAFESHGGRAVLLSDLSDVLTVRANEGPNQKRLAQIDADLAVYGAGPVRTPGTGTSGPVDALLKQRAQVLEAIEKQRLSPPGETDPDRIALARLASDLAAAGFHPDSPGGGRTVRALQERHRQLSAEIEAKRVEAREAVEAEASRMVDGSLAGSLAPLEELIATTSQTPRAFAPGLAKVLSGIPTEALESIPCGAFANI